MPGPVLTPGEQAAIDASLATIAAAQAVLEAPIQVRPGSDSGLVRLGISQETVSAARAAGFDPRVDQYDGPYGRGWVLVLRLTRDGVTWEMAHHEGPAEEAGRGYDWSEVTPWP